jgi:hypothetical protein
MKKFSELVIPNQYVCVFGSGHSVLSLSKEDLERINSNSFVFSINYAPVKIPSHANIHSDRRVTEFLIEHYKTNARDRLLIAREEAFSSKNGAESEFYKSIDYMFSLKNDGLHGNFTIIWIIQLLQKYHPDKTILVFGLDGKIPDNDIKKGKWYDLFTDFDVTRRGPQNVQRKIDDCSGQLKRKTLNKNIYNCNLDSAFDFYPKEDWRKFL